jgi:hypothetical protein
LIILGLAVVRDLARSDAAPDGSPREPAIIDETMS